MLKSLVVVSRSAGNRSKNLRDSTFHYVFVHEYTSINEEGGGMRGLVYKNIDGDKGKSGETLYSACFPHRNPAWCCTGLLGTCEMYRFSFLMEPFPDIHDMDSYVKLPLVRGGTCATRPGIAGVKPDRLRDWTNKYLEDAGVERESGYDPLLHGLRHHCEQQLKAVGGQQLVKDERESFMQRATDVQDRTYAANIVSPSVCVARGFEFSSGRPKVAPHDPLVYCFLCAVPTFACWLRYTA